MNDSQLTDMDLDEDIIATRPWVKQLLQTTMDISKKKVLRWCNIVVKIGEADLDINQNATIFIEQITNLFEDMIEDVNRIRGKSLDKIENLRQHLQGLCKDLHLDIPEVDDHDTRSLSDLRKDLLGRIKEFERTVDSRRKEVRVLNQKQTKLCRSLGRDLASLQESPLPLPEETESFKTQLDALETEAMEREERFFQLREAILEMVNEYQIAPNLDFEREIIGLGKNKVRITDTDMEQLQLYHNKLIAESESIKEEIGDLRTKIDHMWNVLEIDIAHRDYFVHNNPGNSLHTLAALKAETARLDELKKTNLKTFIFRQRAELNDLWNKCHCSEEVRRAFTFYNSDCYTEDLFDLHVMEIVKWRRFYTDNSHMFALINEHKKLWEQHLQLELNSGDAIRYKNRGGQLLTEEKKRNNLKKRIPTIEGKLLDLADSYYLHKGQHFQIFGKTIQEYINQLHSEEDKEFKLKLSAKKQQGEQTSTMHVGKSRILFPLVSPSSTPRNTTKRKVMATPSTEPLKRLKVSSKNAPKTASPKVNTSISKRRRSSRGKGKKLFKGKENATASTGYDEFEKEVYSEDNCRSTIFALKEKNQNPQTPQKSRRLPPKFVLTTPARSEIELTPRGNTYITKTPRNK